MTPPTAPGQPASRRPRSGRRRPLRLRHALTALLFTAQALLLIGVMVAARLGTDRVLRDHAHNIMSHLIRTAADQASRHLAPAERSARLTGQLLEDGVLNVADEAGLRRYFQAQLDNNLSLAALYLGRPDGSFTMVKRDPHGSYVKTVRVGAGGARQVLAQWLDPRGRERRRARLQDAYDPRQRPWYRRALDHAGAVWTEPYVFFTARQPGITSAVRVVQAGRTIGVVGVDIEIASLSGFMQRVPSAEHGVAFMLEQGGNVIAGAPGWSTGRPAGAATELPKVHQVADPATLALLGSLDPTAWASRGEQFTAFRAGGQLQYGLLQPFGLGTDLHWLLLVRAPASDFSHALDTQFRWSLVVVLLVGLASWGLTLPLVSSLARPVEQLHQRATVDDLTGLPNRSEFLEAAGLALGGARRAGQGSAIVMLDLDGFKQVNDQQGHRAGDDLLRIVAQRLRHSLRPDDVIGRLGGDEFALLLPGTTLDAALPVLDRLRAAVSQPIQPAAGTSGGPTATTTTIGVSIGLAEVDTGTPLAEALHRADHAMLHGKAQGKNRTCVAGRATLHPAADLATAVRR